MIIPIIAFYINWPVGPSQTLDKPPHTTRYFKTNQGMESRRDGRQYSIFIWDVWSRL